VASLWRSPRDGRDGRVAAPGPGDRPAPLGLARTPDPDTHPETRALRREQADEVRAVLDRLPPRDRAALVLREYRDLSYAEIGAALGVSRPAVKLLLLRARVRFRREWLRTHGGPPTAADDTPAPGA
jgi:RNA polymerase sigma-70 factor (ECF subfamily)